MVTEINGFGNSVAAIIGINSYTNGIPTLRTAVRDATHLAEILQRDHHYRTELFIEQDASLSHLTHLLTNQLPAILQPQDRLLVYFAGHGIALNDEDGPSGYLVPYGARLENRSSFLPMHQLHQALVALPCRHMLLILDCCFAGAFRWSSTRHLSMTPERMYRERYDRFIRDPAWQVLTSAAYDQQALDVLLRFGQRGDDGEHSPFAQALFAALSGAADRPVPMLDGMSQGDGVITATELYIYLRDYVELGSLDRAQRQTPGLWFLNKHDKGEYIFLVPNRPVNLPPAPLLTNENNPYRGLEPFEERHAELFFGRNEQADELCQTVTSQPLTVVLGASGTGKSSLVMAGLLPRLRSAVAEHWDIIGPLRPGSTPMQALANLVIAVGTTPTLNDRVATWRAAHPQGQLLMVVDQFEELMTLCRVDQEREQFLQELATAIAAHANQFHIVLTVRSDFEPQFQHSALQPWWRQARFVATPMTQDELREAIRGPASVRVLYFEPDTLVDRIINEVVQMPGALPLLSFTLSELYRKYIERRGDKRALMESDYEQLGGVAGALRNRATAEYERLHPELQATMRRVMLRMVALDGGELTRRRVLRDELEYPDAAENDRVVVVIANLTTARLLVSGTNEDGHPYVEPAHDALVLGWDRLWFWVREAHESLIVQRRLSAEAVDWDQSGRKRELLWNDDPRLRQALVAPLRPANVIQQFWQDLTNRRPRPVDWLNRLEREFVVASSQRRSALRQQLVVILTTVIVIFAALTALAWFQRGEAISQSNLRATQESVAQANAAEAQRQEETAVAERERAEQEARIARSRQLAAQAQSQMADHLDLALLLGIEAYHNIDTYEARSSLLAGLNYASGLTALLHGHSGAVESVAFSPNGKLLASGGQDRHIILWDVATRQPVGKPIGQHSRAITSVAFSPDGNTLASGSCSKIGPAGYCDQSELRFWNIATGQPLGSPLTSDLSLDLTEIMFSPDGKTLVVGSHGGTISFWDVSTHELRGEPQSIHNNSVSSLAFSSDSSMLAVGSWDQTIVIMDMATRQPIGSPLPANDRAVSSLAFSPDGKLLASGGWDHSIILWDMPMRERRGEPLYVGTSAVLSLAFSPDEKMVTAISADSSVYRADVTAPGLSLPRFKKQGHGVALNSVVLSSDGQHFAALDSSNAISLWTIDMASSVSSSVSGHTHPVGLSAFSPDGNTLMTLSCEAADTSTTIGCSGWEIRQWDVALHRPLDSPRTGFGKIGGRLDSTIKQELVALSPDTKILALVDNEGEVTLWNVAEQQLLSPSLKPDVGSVTSVTFSPDSKTLAAAVVTPSSVSIILWDVAARKLLGSPIRTGFNSSTNSIVFAADGQMLAAASCVDEDRVGLCNQSDIRLWNVATRKQIGSSLSAHFGRVSSLAFSPDGKILASSGNSPSIILWDVATQQPLEPPLSGYNKTVEKVVFSPNGKLFASVASEGTIVLWDVTTHQIFGQLLAEREIANNVITFSPNNSVLVAAGADGVVTFWDLDPHMWQASACNIANRNLTRDEWQQFMGNTSYSTTCPDLPPG